MKKHLIIGITVLFIVSCFVYVLSELYSAKILVPPDLKAGLNPAADVSSETEKMSPDEARRHQIRQLAEREQLKLGMEFKNAEIKWHLEQDEAYCFFDITSPDIGEELVERVGEGDHDAETIWSDLTARLQSVQKGIQKQFNDEDLDIAVVLQVLDPQNKKETLLSAAHGVVGYDVVNHLDLKNTPAEPTDHTSEAPDEPQESGAE